ncbi:MAG: hypothetical protein U0797_18510 [Gemmataceae bacterium]
MLWLVPEFVTKTLFVTHVTRPAVTGTSVSTRWWIFCSMLKLPVTSKAMFASPARSMFCGLSTSTKNVSPAKAMLFKNVTWPAVAVS